MKSGSENRKPICDEYIAAFKAVPQQAVRLIPANQIQQFDALSHISRYILPAKDCNTATVSSYTLKNGPLHPFTLSLDSPLMLTKPFQERSG